MLCKLSSIRLDSYTAKYFYTSVANLAIFPVKTGLFSEFHSWLLGGLRIVVISGFFHTKRLFLLNVLCLAIF